MIRAAHAASVDLCPGVPALDLWRDPGSPRLLQLFRCQPGARFPAHHHSGLEECDVLEGDITFGEVELHAGDYPRAAELLRHGHAFSRGGCVPLLSRPG